MMDCMMGPMIVWPLVGVALLALLIVMIVKFLRKP
jgi:hypothetical protein